MLQELLYALHGYHGGVFSMNDNKLQVSNTFSNFHNSEIQVLNRILEVATDYCKLDSFIKSWKANRGKQCLFYMGALCEGFEQVLSPYRQLIVKMEKYALNSGGDLHLSQIQCRLHPFKAVLSGLVCLLQQIELRKPYGCYLLDLLYKSTFCGVAELEVAMKRILFEVHKVLYKQLLDWLMHGHVFDPDEEFFVSLSQDKVLTQGLSSYTLRSDMVPSYLSSGGMAEKILFVGQSIPLLNAKENQLNHVYEGKVNVLSREREITIYQKLLKLQNCEEFSMCELEKFVDEVTLLTSRHLYKLIMEQADLRKELRTLREFFLLGRGELFRVFIHMVEPFFSEDIQLSKSTSHDVHRAFVSACRSIHIPEDDLAANRITVKLNWPPNKKQDPSTSDFVNGWSCLSMEYSVPWSLHLIFTPNILEKYDLVFQNLLYTKRIQMMLHKLWSFQMQRKNASTNPEHCQLRSHMSFIVDNLQHYLMSDVLESQWSDLKKKLEVTDDFETVCHTHQVFISAIIAETFVGNKLIGGCLRKLLSSCYNFYCFMQEDEDNMDQRRRHQKNKECLKFSEIAESFSNEFQILFQLLTTLKHHHSGQHLAQLLIRLDYNKYFSQNGYQIGAMLAG